MFWYVFPAANAVGSLFREGFWHDDWPKIKLVFEKDKRGCAGDQSPVALSSWVEATYNIYWCCTGLSRERPLGNDVRKITGCLV